MTYNLSELMRASGTVATADGQPVPAASLSADFDRGSYDALMSHQRPQHVRDAWAACRHQYGLSSTARGVNSPLLTAPAGNMKLAKGDMPIYGLTLRPHLTKLSTGLTVNACPRAGDCASVCVLRNGRGEMSNVEAARRARTHLATVFPHEFAYMLGYELARVVIKEGSILFRPNVASDIEWQHVIPALTNGQVFGDAVKSLGYTKMLDVLDTGGWLDSHYRVAFSHSEKLGVTDRQVREFIARGGSVSVATNRRPGDPIRQWDSDFPVVDADKTDEWIFEAGVIGDLSFKRGARGRALLERGTHFVHHIYEGT